MRCKMEQSLAQPSHRGCDTDACACTGTQRVAGRGAPLSAVSRHYPCLTKLKRSILTATLHQLPWPLSGAPVTKPTTHVDSQFHTHGETFHARLSPAARPSPVTSERGCMHDCWAGPTASILRSQHVRCKLDPGPAQSSRRGCDTDASTCTGTQRLRGRRSPLSAVFRHYPCLTKNKTLNPHCHITSTAMANQRRPRHTADPTR